ncbi:MAG: fumarylacetoacetate hydrolase family protein [Candidatus Krumholzibacteria bacterium]|nr:fumarylacetoacetate hydrolase family protein [Candidatus Krumholzibacteria bacterium]
MKLVSFEKTGRRAGVIVGDMILDASSALRCAPLTVEEIFRRGLLPEVQNLADNASEIDREYFIPLNGARLYAPIQSPSKIVCLGLNYLDHALEQKKDPPARPMLFAKAPSALAGPYDDIVIRPGVEDVDAEAELAVVIARDGTMIPASEALNHVAGYMAFNDVSARKIQRDDRQWFRSKSFDTFAPCGPWLVTTNEIGDPNALAIRQRLGEIVMQESSTSRMIFPVSELISFISSAMTLMPGDIIATGTPAGVGVFREPPVFLEDGDVVTIEIEGIGYIKNRVRKLR